MTRAFLGYVALFGVLFAPCLPRMAHVVSAVTNPDDAMLIVWILAWVSHALATNPGVLFDANINYPAPGQLTGSEHFLSFQSLFAPLWWITSNPVLSTNIVLFVTYPLAGILMYQLLRSWEVRSEVAWLAGMVFALGPLYVPPNLQLLQFCSVFLPLTALAIGRLRRQPSAGTAVRCALALIAALLSSYYMAVMALVVAGTWAFVELVADTGDRSRFLTWLAACATVSLVCLSFVSRPYLQRATTLARWPSVSGAATMSWSLVTALITALPKFFDIPMLIVSVSVGVLTFTVPSRRLRLLAAGGLALWLIGTVAILFWSQLAALGLPQLTGFFRGTLRLLVVVGFGATLAGAAGLEALCRRVPGAIARLVIVTVAAAVVFVRGLPLAAIPEHEVTAIGNPGLYANVGHVAARMGGGALLELPVAGPPGPPGHFGPNTLEPDAMVGSTFHWLPLVTGFTGYQPPHRRLLLQTLAHLVEDPEAFGLLVDMTHVRWLLLRPSAQWPDPNARNNVRDALLASHDVEPVWSDDGWELMRVLREPRHPDWFAAIQRGTRLDETVLGTPLQRLRTEDAIAVITATSPSPVAAGKAFLLPITVKNAGRVTWPVAAQPRVALPGALNIGPSSTAYTVELVLHWHVLRGPRQTNHPARILLARDLPAGEAIQTVALVPSPPAPGTYRIDIRPRQVRGARFDVAGNAPWRKTIVVE